MLSAKDLKRECHLGRHQASWYHVRANDQQVPCLERGKLSRETRRLCDNIVLAFFVVKKILAENDEFGLSPNQQPICEGAGEGDRKALLLRL